MSFTRSSLTLTMATCALACGHVVSTERQIAATGTLCDVGEQVLFSCRIKGKEKTASVCASPEWRKREGYIVYRYGRLGQVEFSYPSEKVGSFDRFYFSSYVRPLVTQQSLRFENGGYEYVIETNSNEEEAPGVDEATLSIAGPKSAELVCEGLGRQGIDVGIADVVPCDPEGMGVELSCQQK